jgi:hypothetical protein
MLQVEIMCAISAMVRVELVDEGNWSRLFPRVDPNSTAFESFAETQKRLQVKVN